MESRSECEHSAGKRAVRAFVKRSGCEIWHYLRSTPHTRPCVMWIFLLFCDYYLSLHCRCHRCFILNITHLKAGRRSKPCHLVGWLVWLLVRRARTRIGNQQQLLLLTSLTISISVSVWRLNLSKSNFKDPLLCDSLIRSAVRELHLKGVN